MAPRDDSATLPPNQALASPHKWPLVGEHAPRPSPAPWSLTIDGLVDHPRTWSLAELRALPQRDFTTDIHCVTRWSKLGMRFSGLPLADLLAACGPVPAARFASFTARSARDHSTSLPLADALELGAFIAFTANGAELAVKHGGPMRTIVPGRYFYKSLKWLERIELLPQDRLGWWEDHAGYHNNADPVYEQRYVSRQHDRRAIMAMIQRRDLSGQDLLGLQAPGISLGGLNAVGALLRDADFRGALLNAANFTQANLSNAHFDRADLRDASFRDADLEGSSFLGADLRGTDFSGASLFGATFCPEPAETEAKPARHDHTTRFQPDQLEALTERQINFLTSRL